jgi:hypothetical protein
MMLKSRGTVQGFSSEWSFIKMLLFFKYGPNHIKTTNYWDWIPVIARINTTYDFFSLFVGCDGVL